MARASMVFAIVMLTAFSIVAAAGPKAEKKTFTGTWVCLACDLKNVESVRAQCEDFGHRHCLKLNDGKYVQFLENDHSIDLIKGGGRHDTEITVTGLYDSNARTIDVENYTIDGRTSTWCAAHSKMDMCEWQAKHKDDKGGKANN